MQPGRQAQAQVFVERVAQVGLALGLAQLLVGAHLGATLGPGAYLHRAAQIQLTQSRVAIAACAEQRTHRGLDLGAQGRLFRARRRGQAGGRCLCIGTTSVRTLETVADETGAVHAQSGETGIFITPGYRYRAVDALVTNFHLPESTLIMLVSAFAGFDHIMHAYNTAVAEKYRFFSFGDAMFIC